MRQPTAVSLTTQDGVIVRGEMISGSSDIATILLHPHPMLGGNMDNNVVEALFQGLSSLAWLTLLRINFRQSITGTSARNDVQAAIDFLVKSHNKSRVVIVGYSFGSAVGNYIASTSDKVIAFCAVSPPHGWLSWTILGHHFKKTVAKPTLHVIGHHDQFTSLAQFRTLVKNQPPGSAHLSHEVQQADHFWFGLESFVVGRVLTWFTEDLSLSPKM